MDLKAQSKHRDKNCPIWMYTKLFEVKKWLNMNSKQDKEYGKGDDITYYLKLLRILDTGKIYLTYDGIYNYYNVALLSNFLTIITILYRHIELF